MVAIASSFYAKAEKLRRLARVAEKDNSYINAPLKLPTAWAAGQVITVGEVRSNAGSMFVAVTAGTTGATPPTIITDGNSHSDGTVSWTYYGGPQLSADDTYVPTVTASASSSAPPSSLLLRNPTTAPTQFRMYGGVPVNNGNFWAYTVFRRRSVVEGGTSMRVGFITDAPKFAIATSNNSDPNTRVEIDGRYYSVGDIPYTTGATYNWLLFDFSAGQQRKTRLVIRDSAKSGSGQFGGVAVSALDTVWAPPTADDVKVIFIGDSMLAGSGYGPYICGGDVPQILGRLLGWSDVQNWGVGGTGWTSATADYTYGQRIADSSNLATLATADVVLFQGSTNDFGSSSATVAAAVTSALTAVRSANANCLIIVFGVWPTNSASVPTVETGISNGVSAFGDPRTFFLPIYGDTPLPWVTGAWNNSADTNSVNATMWLSGDGTHPPDLGSIYMAQRMARAIRTSVLPVI